MATDNRIKEAQRSTLEYRPRLWGDLIYGTKEELQALGIGKEMAFPGEPGGPKRTLRVRDPRGLDTKVEHHYDNIYSSRIHFPGRERTPTPWTTVAPGVRRCSSYWRDEYVGTAEALAGAGLVQLNHLPGQPGMRKHTVTIYPDGTIPAGAPTANHKQADMPGAKCIKRASKTTYRVYVVVAKDEQSRRDAARIRDEREYEACMCALPRPAPLPGLSHKPQSGDQARPEGQKAEIPGTIDEHRRKLLGHVYALQLMCNSMLDDENDFYHLAADDQQKLSEAWSQITGIVAGATIRPRRFAVIDGGLGGRS